MTTIYLLTGTEIIEIIEQLTTEKKDFSQWVEYLKNNIITDKLKRIINKSIMNKAKERYQSAREMLLDLSFDNGDEILEAIERWSGAIAKLYLSTEKKVIIKKQLKNKLCKLVLDNRNNYQSDPNTYITDLIKEHIIKDWESINTLDISNTQDQEIKNINNHLFNNIYSDLKTKTSQIKNFQSNNILKPYQDLLNQDPIKNESVRVKIPDKSTKFLFFFNMNNNENIDYINQIDKLINIGLIVKCEDDKFICIAQEAYPLFFDDNWCKKDIPPDSSPPHKWPQAWITKTQNLITQNKYLTVIFLVILGVLLAVILGILSGKIEMPRIFPEPDQKIEQNADNAIELYKEKKGLESLTLALKSGISLSSKVKPETKISDHPTVRPILALQSHLYNYNHNHNHNIFEINKHDKHSAKINTISFSEDESYLISASDNENDKIIIWDFKNSFNQSNLNKVTENIQGSIKSIQSIPNQLFFVSGGIEKQIINLWKTSGEFVKNYTVNNQGSGEIKSIRVSNDGKILITLFAIKNADTELKIWEILCESKSKCKLKENSIFPKDTYSSVDISDEIASDHYLITTANSQGKVQLWELSNKSYKPEILNTISPTVQKVYFTPNGKFIVTVGNKGKIQFWDKNLKEIPIQDNPLTDETGDGTQIDFVKKRNCKSSNDCKDHYLMALSMNLSDIKLFELENLDDNKQPIKITLINSNVSNQDIVTSLAFSPKGNYLAVGGQDKTVKVWDLSNLYKVVDPVFPIEDSPIKMLKVGQQENKTQYIIYLLDNGIIRLRKIEDDSGLLRELKDKDKAQNILANFISVVQDKILTVDKTVDKDQKYSYWDYDGKYLGGKIHSEKIKSIILDDDNKYFVLIEDDGDAYLYNESGNEATAKKLNNESTTDIENVSFQPKGNFLLVIKKNSEKEKIKLYNTEKKLYNSNFKDYPYYKIAKAEFTPDSQYLVTIEREDEKHLHIWKIRKDNNKVEFERLKLKELENEIVDSFVINPYWNQSNDSLGQVLVTLNGSNELKLWDLQGRQIAQFYGKYKNIKYMTFSIDGKKLIAAGDKNIDMWDLENIQLDKLINKGCSKLENYLNSYPEDKDNKKLEKDCEKLTKVSK